MWKTLIEMKSLEGKCPLPGWFPLYSSHFQCNDISYSCQSITWLLQDTTYANTMWTCKSNLSHQLPNLKTQQIPPAWNSGSCSPGRVIPRWISQHPYPCFLRWGFNCSHHTAFSKVRPRESASMESLLMTHQHSRQCLHPSGIKTGLFLSRLRMQALEHRHVTGHSKMPLITVWHSLYSQLQKNQSFFLSSLAAEGTVFT